MRRKSIDSRLEKVDRSGEVWQEVGSMNERNLSSTYQYGVPVVSRVSLCWIICGKTFADVEDLSTLHALRDTTLSHTHSLLAYLMTTHSIPASYRLLPRSAINGPQKPRTNCRHQPGWGCIRLAPSITSPVQHKRELKPAVRRTSAVYPRRPSVAKHGRKSSKDQVADDVPPFRLDLDNAIADDEDEDVQVELKEGYRTGGSSDDECEEECADVLVAREVEKRGTKEG